MYEVTFKGVRIGCARRKVRWSWGGDDVQFRIKPPNREIM